MRHSRRIPSGSPRALLLIHAKTLPVHSARLRGYPTPVVLPVLPALNPIEALQREKALVERSIAA